MMCPVVIGADQYEVGQFGGPPSSSAGWWACRPRVAPQPGTAQLAVAVLEGRRSRRLITRVVRPAPMSCPLQETRSRRWHHT